MENPHGACALFRLWFSAHERQGLLTTGKRIDNPAYFPIYSGWGMFLRIAKAQKADQNAHAFLNGHKTYLCQRRLWTAKQDIHL
jgi:hypothetical protein